MKIITYKKPVNAKFNDAAECHQNSNAVFYV